MQFFETSIYFQVEIIPLLQQRIGIKKMKMSNKTKKNLKTILHFICNCKCTLYIFFAGRGRLIE